jgi:hypothetical protein
MSHFKKAVNLVLLLSGLSLILISLRMETAKAQCGFMVSPCFSFVIQNSACTYDDLCCFVITEGFPNGCYQETGPCVTCDSSGNCSPSPGTGIYEACDETHCPCS